MEEIKTRDRELIFMGRILEDHYGSAGLDKLLEYKAEKTKNEWKKRAVESGRQDPGFLLQLFTDKVHDYEVIKNNEKCLEVKVNKCKHAEIFKSFNAEDLGEKLICEGDKAVVAGYNPDINLYRPEIAMTGECCHFIFKIDKED
ncbi:MAG: L-2-amino-thiazoline-4-carboxylic acid hydrolase [Bacillota bacterium]